MTSYSAGVHQNCGKASKIAASYYANKQPSITDYTAGIDVTPPSNLAVVSLARFNFNSLGLKLRFNFNSLGLRVTLTSRLERSSKRLWCSRSRRCPCAMEPAAIEVKGSIHSDRANEIFSKLAANEGLNEVAITRHLSLDEEGADADVVEPLIGRSFNEQRWGRCLSDGNIGGLRIQRGQSLRQGVGHAAAETYLVTGLSFKLLRYLGIGYRWMTRFLALGCYALFLLPGFLQIGYYYYFSKCVHRSIVYGDEPRNRLDLYIPENINEPKPVVAFVTGGAWIIGYKAWGSLLGQELVERDIIVACFDYRNFPQGTISDMVKDTSQGISYVCQNIADYGGDPNRIYLVGQSAGAHISACTLVDQAKKEATIGRTELSWSTSQIKAYFGISGGYNLPGLVGHFHKRGLYRSVFLSIMEGEHSLPLFSPEVVIQNPSFRDAVSLLPPIYLLHGTGDYSIPSEASTSFVDTLHSVGAKAELRLYRDKTHTDLFLQDPMRGGRDEMLEDILAVIHAADPVAQANDANAPPRRRLVPEILLQLARKVSPF